MHPEERQFVPVAALEHDQAIADVEETASVQEGRAGWQLPIPAAPFPDCPFAVLEQIENLSTAATTIAAARPRRAGRSCAHCCQARQSADPARRARSFQASRVKTISSQRCDSWSLRKLY